MDATEREPGGGASCTGDGAAIITTATATAPFAASDCAAFRACDSTNTQRGGEIPIFARPCIQRATRFRARFVPGSRLGFRVAD